jgi:hypothetical protein
MKIRTILQTAVFLLASSFALGGSSTITVLDSVGATKTFDVVTDGSGHFVGMSVVCDQSAAANCAGVDSGHSLQVAGEGTAGSAAGGVMTVQGSASGTAIPVTVSGVATAASQSTNGATTAHTCSTGGFSELGCLGQIDDDIKAALPAGTNVIGFNSNDPCTQSSKTNVPISTASGTVALVTGVSAKKIYVCSLSLIASGAISVSLSEGSGSTCGTSAQAGVIGVATNGTAANGMALAANGGLTLGNGGATVAVTATAANYLCLFQSGTTQIAGNLTYVQQ